MGLFSLGYCVRRYRYSVCFPSHHALPYHPPTALRLRPELEESRNWFSGDYYQHNSTHNFRLSTSSYYGRLPSVISACLNDQPDLCRELVGLLAWFFSTDCCWLTLQCANRQPHPIHQLGLRRSSRVFIWSCTTVSTRDPTLGGGIGS